MKRFFKRKFRTEKKFWSKIELKKKNISFSQNYFQEIIVKLNKGTPQPVWNLFSFLGFFESLGFVGFFGSLLCPTSKLNEITNWRLEILAFRLLVTHWLLSFLAPLLSLTPSNHAFKASLSNDVFWEWVKLNFFS